MNHLEKMLLWASAICSMVPVVMRYKNLPIAHLCRPL